MKEKENEHILEKKINTQKSQQDKNNKKSGKWFTIAMYITKFLLLPHVQEMNENL